MVLGHGAEERQAGGAATSLFVNVNSQRVDITDRNVVVASVPQGASHCSRMSAHRDHLVGGRHLRHVRRPHRSDDRQGTADRVRRPEPAALDRRRLHRPDRARAAGADRCRPTIDTRFSTKPTALKLAAMVRGHRRDHRRAGRAVAAGPARRPPDAAAWIPAALAHLHRRRRRRRRRLPGVARHRRQLLRRRLHPRHGPRRRPRRLHVELLPLVRQSRGPVRLVLQPAGADDPRQRCEHLDAAAGSGVRRWCAGCCCPARCCPGSGPRW